MDETVMSSLEPVREKGRNGSGHNDCGDVAEANPALTNLYAKPLQ